jgi:hypothetical protein
MNVVGTNHLEYMAVYFAVYRWDSPVEYVKDINSLE